MKIHKSNQSSSRAFFKKTDMSVSGSLSKETNRVAEISSSLTTKHQKTLNEFLHHHQINNPVKNSSQMDGISTEVRIEECNLSNEQIDHEWTGNLKLS
ncbi:unnamed protein product [Allacma fusca]|uniref:Uncharacterized protein n=1 Tax=Allacma fusca TaxID=39272 RepID=A0A8J2P158_9HEXA|nr:unnamed protein product [Allacma fusca]